MDVGSFADVSEEDLASIYRVEVWEVVEVLSIYKFFLKNKGIHRYSFILQASTLKTEPASPAEFGVIIQGLN